MPGGMIYFCRPLYRRNTRFFCLSLYPPPPPQSVGGRGRDRRTLHDSRDHQVLFLLFFPRPRPTAVPFHVRSILFLPRGAAATAAAGAPKERLEKREGGRDGDGSWCWKIQSPTERQRVRTEAISRTCSERKSVDFSSVLMMTKTVKRPSDDKASSNRCDIVVVRA